MFHFDVLSFFEINYAKVRLDQSAKWLQAGQPTTPCRRRRAAHPVSSSVDTGDSFLAVEQPELEAENDVSSVAFYCIYVVNRRMILYIDMGGTIMWKEAAMAYFKP